MPNNGAKVAELEDLDVAQCEALLQRHSFGRLAFIESGDRPTILPVNYAFEGDGLSIRTSAGSKLTHSPLSWLALEIDGVDTDGRWGWSVVAGGYAFDITSALDDRSFNLREMTVEPMAPGERNHYLSIHVRSLTGRAFGNVPDLPEVDVR